MAAIFWPSPVFSLGVGNLPDYIPYGTRIREERSGTLEFQATFGPPQRRRSPDRPPLFMDFRYVSRSDSLAREVDAFYENTLERVDRFNWEDPRFPWVVSAQETLYEFEFRQAPRHEWVAKKETWQTVLSLRFFPWLTFTWDGT